MQNKLNKLLFITLFIIAGLFSGFSFLGFLKGFISGNLIGIFGGAVCAIFAFLLYKATGYMKARNPDDLVPLENKLQKPLEKTRLGKKIIIIFISIGILAWLFIIIFLSINGDK